VVAEVTAETLRLHRGLAVERHRRSLQDLARRLSISGRRHPAPPSLAAWIEGRRPLPAHVAYLEDRYGGEPYRLVLSLLAADLESASKEDMAEHLLDEAVHPARAHASELERVLDLIAAAIPPALAADALRTVRGQVEIFGLHAARLDVREESTRLTMALGALLSGLGIAERFEQQSSQARASCFSGSCPTSPHRLPMWRWPPPRPRPAPRPGGSSGSSLAPGASTARRPSARSSSR